MAALSERVLALDSAIRAAPPHVCAERAVLVTRSCRARREPLPPGVRSAMALRYVLERKAVRIYPRELLVGCFTAHRVGGSIYPELHGVAMLEDLLSFHRRPVNPLAITPADRHRLLAEVLPYWLPRFLAIRAQAPLASLRFLADQLDPTCYLINESGGIAHLLPDYPALLAIGTAGLREQAAAGLARVPPGAPEAAFFRAVGIACDGLEAFADGYRREAERLASAEGDAARRDELLAMARTCARVPRRPAETLHEALQSMLFAQIALNLESLDNGISPGRLDQVLHPFYQRDVGAGRLDPDKATELLACFALKLCELIPVLSGRVTRFHGGLMSGQAVIVGGTDAAGADATNELTYLLLDLMERLRTRQPNFHARLHPGSPPAYRQRIASMLSRGAASPAVFNDAVVVPALVARGIPEPQARGYATVGCVEPAPPGNSFLSTDAALVNLPLLLELALNGGRRFGSIFRTGAATPEAATCRGIDDLVALFETQLAHVIRRLFADLRAIEEANARRHPTPLTSMLVAGCLAAGRDVTEGGAIHDGSGIQGVGAVEVGDGLAAVEAVVFRDRHATLAEVVSACRAGFDGHEPLRMRLTSAPKYGNDDEGADRHTARVMDIFARSLAGRTSFRGGDYAAGFYSMTAHHAFGAVVGALPSGRRAGEPFSSGLSPGHGAARRGPTAALASLGRLPSRLAANGTNYNLELAPWMLADAGGAPVLEALIAGAFELGAMQLQVNVLDARVLEEARDDPRRHPGLLVRVSGYCAYFADLSPAMQQEIIDRTLRENRAG